MKKILFTTLFTLLVVNMNAQTENKKGMNTLAEEYLKKSVGTLIIDNPDEVTVKKIEKGYSIKAKGFYNGHAYDIKFTHQTEPLQFITIESNGINGNEESEIVFKDAERIEFSKIPGRNETVIKKEGNDSYSYRILLQGMAEKTKTVYTERDTSWDFEVPFVNIQKKSNSEKKIKKRVRFIVDPTFGFGLLGATAQGEGVDLSFSNGSYEFIIDGIAGIEYRTSRNSNIGLIFGVDWRNYRMVGDRMFTKESDKIIIKEYPTGANIDFSRIQIFSLTLSLEYEYKFSKYLGFSIGSIVNFNTGGNTKTRWSVEGEAFKERLYNIHQQPVTIDFKAEIFSKFIGLYFKYSPCDVLVQQHGPGFRSMSAGLLIGF